MRVGRRRAIKALSGKDVMYSIKDFKSMHLIFFSNRIKRNAEKLLQALTFSSGSCRYSAF